MVNHGENGHRHVIILDTSFLIGYHQHQYWTAEAFSDIKRSETHVVVPRGVEGEYNRLMNTKLLRF